MSKKSATIGASAGNFLETYNFTIYAFFAPMIAGAFFPARNHLTSLLYALLAFAVGFVARPLGAVAMGAYEKSRGRPATLQLVFLLMGIGTLMLAATPSYATVGAAAPVIVILARILQGFSEGGEMGPATTLLLDLAPPGRGAHFVALQPITQILAGLAAVFFGAGVSALCPHAALYAWGWRLPFLLGLIIIPTGLMLRRNITDGATAGSHSAETQKILPKTPIVFSAKILRRTLLLMLLLGAGSISSYAQLFGVSYGITVLHLSPLIGMVSMAAGMAASLVAMLGGLRLARLISPRRMVISTSIFGLVVTYPAYHFAITVPGLGSFVLLNLLLSGVTALPAGFIVLTMLEALPAQQRSAQFGLIYAVTISFCGGFTQPVLAWLIRDTGSAYVPCWVLLTMTVIALSALLKLGIGRDRLGRPIAQPLAPVGADMTA